ncbi:4,5-DOPA-extradiol-dioxygenase [Myroides injenensis]|uniref:4,5-DOPA-extradiol-dioxygenase n=1 Tax=Myroides injenensis TaxID=1183151 RepID=UPI000289AB17|nr:4,5-DOPA dioxygenase extradiol [Myroides injenensis]
MVHQVNNAINDLLKHDNTGYRMPVLFIGHGSPMNAIENNEFSRYWERLGQSLPKPRAIVVVSAHWLTRGTFVTAAEQPITIHDFGGFPQELFDVQYPCDGAPNLAVETQHLITSTDVHEDLEWGLDHGSWSILRRMYPDANIPVIQLSIDYYQSGDFHYKIGQEIAALRNKGVLIIGSGNIVHNLRQVDWARITEDNYGYDWAKESNSLITRSVLERDNKSLINYRLMGEATHLAVPTPDHYYPLLYVLGASNSNDQITIFNDKFVGGSLSMTSYIFH